jgi:hypothetical protein
MTGNRAVPGLWLAFAAVCGLIAALVARPHSVVEHTHATLSVREAVG